MDSQTNVFMFLILLYHPSQLDTACIKEEQGRTDPVISTGKRLKGVAAKIENYPNFVMQISWQRDNKSIKYPQKEEKY